MSLPIIGITAGDPAGIGYELALRTLAQKGLHDTMRPIIYGSRPCLERDLGWLGLEVQLITHDPSRVRLPERTHADQVLVRDVGLPEDDTITLGDLQPAAGDIAVRSVRVAVGDALNGHLDAICTAPLNKESMWQAGHRYDGHTGLLSELCDGSRVSMLLVGERLRVAHVTTHVAFEDVPGRLSIDRIVEVIDIAGKVLRSLGMPTPRIAVAGLNPHAGEHGLFGDQEETVIGPAVEHARAQGWQVTGPISPDAVFNAALAGQYDIVVAMYHDQGHIPIKLIEFDRAVNISGGLPIVRTSVDHGTAFDIAGRGIARTDNLVAALDMAATMGRNRTAALNPKEARS